MSLIKILNIKAIRIDGGTQSRAEINNQAVQEYAEAVTGGAKFPAITVFFDGADYWLADGFHRWHGHNAAGKTSIEAEVRTGTQRDAVLFSTGVNASHGIQRLNADKRKAVLTLLNDSEWTLWSNRAISEQCHVSHFLVNSIRTAIEEATQPKLPKKEAHVEEIPDALKKEATSAPNAPSEGATERKFMRGGVLMAAKVKTPGNKPSTAAPQVPTPEEAAAIANANIAYEGKTLSDIVDEQVIEINALQALVAAAEAVDHKAEVMKWRRMHAVAERRQNELMTSVNEREAELRRVQTALRRIGKAVGEDNPTKIAAKVEELARNIAAVAEGVA